MTNETTSQIMRALALRYKSRKEGLFSRKILKISKFLLISLIITFQSGCVLKWGVDYLKDKSLECNKIQDIYYYPSTLYNVDYFAKTQTCPYTLNVCSKSCSTVYIKRQFYDSYKAEYESLGLAFPYPERTGDYGVIYPK